MNKSKNGEKERTASIYEASSERQTTYKLMNKKVLENGDNALRLLDVGCGTGFYRTLIPEDWEYVGTSIRLSEIEYGKEHGINIVDANLLDSGFQDEEFDVIVCVYTLFYELNQIDAFKDLCRILKKNGYLYIIYDTDGAHSDYFSILSNNAFRILASLFGCELTEIVIFPRESSVSRYLYIIKKKNEGR